MCGAEIDTWYGYSHNEEMVKKKREKERLIKLRNTPKGRLLLGKNIASKYILNKRYAHYSVTTCDTSKVDTVQITGIR